MEVRAVEASVWMGYRAMGADDVATDKGIPAAIDR
jgi:hypothetical protein